MTNFSRALAELRQERSRAQKKLGQLDAAISALQGLAGSHPAATREARPRARRRLSAAARKKISIAQKARWAELRNRKGLVGR